MPIMDALSYRPMSGRRALIVGIGGQDGSYLSEFLLGHGYELHGLVRHSTAELPSGSPTWPAGSPSSAATCSTSCR